MSQRISGGFREKRAFRARRVSAPLTELCGTLVIAALAVSLPQAVRAETPADAFTMIMFDRAPGAIQIESGEYGLAARIARTMAVTDAASRFESLTQICVASLKSGELEAARSACDRAVVAARTRSTGTPIYSTSDPRARITRQVIAYTNRGVVHAISGDEMAAVRDLEAALRLNADQREPRANLAYLERRADFVADSKD